MFKIEDYYIDSYSAGILTMLEKSEAIDAIITLFFTAFGMNWSSASLDIQTCKLNEELALYTPLETVENIRKIKVRYNGRPIAIAKLVQDTKDLRANITFNVYNPVIGCTNGCTYCYTQSINEQFHLVDDWHQPIFRGMYKITKDAEGNDVPELFMKRSNNGKPIGWMLTYYSDFGYWKPEWQQNVLEQIIAAINLRKKHGEHPDTFSLLTKNPTGIELGFIPNGFDLREVCFGVSVDKNSKVIRIKQLIERLKHIKSSVMISYQPLLEHIDPTYLS